MSEPHCCSSRHIWERRPLFPVALYTQGRTCADGQAAAKGIRATLREHGGSSGEREGMAGRVCMGEKEQGHVLFCVGASQKECRPL